MLSSTYLRFGFVYDRVASYGVVVQLILYDWEHLPGRNHCVKKPSR